MATTHRGGVRDEGSQETDMGLMLRLLGDWMGGFAHCAGALWRI